jgi:hypothetical protein
MIFVSRLKFCSLGWGGAILKNVFRVAMKPKKVDTPGGYDLGKTTPPKKKVGRPSAVQKPKPRRRTLKHRFNYTEIDVLEAVRLVVEEEFCIKAAAMEINSVKTNAVPRTTLSDRLKKETPTLTPTMGRPVVLKREVEEALVKCLEMCAEYGYPMRKRDLQDLVQAYCTEHCVKTNWVNHRPGRHWIRHFRRRWAHRVKVRKPSNIKRSRAKVSPETVKDFFKRIEPQLEGVPRYNIFNFDESPFQA